MQAIPLTEIVCDQDLCIKPVLACSACHLHFDEGDFVNRIDCFGAPRVFCGDCVEELMDLALDLEDPS